MPDEDEKQTPGWKLPNWILPLLIGIVSITAGLTAWRGGQLGSSAAFEDRQAVGQTIRQQEQFVEARLGAAAQADSYVAYVADFSEASALDSIADELEAGGEPADAARADADAFRETASELAVARQIFTEQQLLRQLATNPDEPLPFDLERKVSQLEAEAAIGFGSPGVLDPDSWADQADDTRHRVRELRLAVLGMLAIIVVFTVAQLSDKRMLRRISAGGGSVAFIGILALTFGGPF